MEINYTISHDIIILITVLWHSQGECWREWTSRYRHYGNSKSVIVVRVKFTQTQRVGTSIEQLHCCRFNLCHFHTVSTDHSIPILSSR